MAGTLPMSWTALWRAMLWTLLLVAGSAQAAGEPLGPPEQLLGRPGHDLYGVQLARAASGAYAALWVESANGTSPAGYYVRAYAADGTPRGPATLVDPSLEGQSYISTRIVMDASGRFLVAWEQTGIVKGRHFAEDGAPMGPSIRLATTTLGVLYEAWDVTMAPDGSYALMMQRQIPTPTNVLTLTLHRFDPGGRARLLQPAALRLDLGVYTPSTLGVPRYEYYRVSISNRIAIDAQGNIVLASLIVTEPTYTPGTLLNLGTARQSYRGVLQLRRIGPGGMPVGKVVTVADYDVLERPYYTDPALARTPDGRVAIVWLQPGEGLKLRQYSADLATATAGQLVSSTLMPGGRFHLGVSEGAKAVVAWAEPRLLSEPYGDLLVRARIYDATGAPLSGIIDPQGAIPGKHDQPQLGVDGQGNFVIGWQVMRVRPDGMLEYPVYLRRYSGL